VAVQQRPAAGGGEECRGLYFGALGWRRSGRKASWRCEETRCGVNWSWERPEREVPRRGRRRRRRRFIGNKVPIEIEEHQWGTGKLALGSMGPRGAWWRLPMAMPSAAGVEGEGRLWGLGRALEN
jgi:hypothetical protein